MIVAAYRNTVGYSHGRVNIITSLRAAKKAAERDAELARQAAEERIQRKLESDAELRRMREEQRARYLRETAERAEALCAEFGFFLRRHTYRSIEQRACKLFKLTRDEITSDRRNKEVVFARQFIVYWCCRFTSLSLPQIGKLMGRDHSTILHAKRAYVAKRAKMGRTLRNVR